MSATPMYCLRRVLALTLLLECTLVAPARAQQSTAHSRRIALIIGNANYEAAPLKNPVHDAELMAQVLQVLGFKVTIGTNLDRDGMRSAIRNFGRELKPGGVALFYYAGHGVQVDGANYIVPVGTDIRDEDDVIVESIGLAEVMAKLEESRDRVNIVVLDACRNNPFARSFRSPARGLAQVDAPTGTLIAYATAPGAVALDGDGNNSLYTTALSQEVRRKGVKLEDAFKSVRRRVYDATNGQQVPWESNSVMGDFYFVPADVAPATLSPSIRLWDPPKTGPSVTTYVVGGVGLGASIAGGIFGTLALLEQNKAEAACGEQRRASIGCSDAAVQLSKKALLHANLANAGFGLGVVGLGVAAILWLTNGSQRELNTSLEVALDNNAGTPVLRGSF